MLNITNDLQAGLLTDERYFSSRASNKLVKWKICDFDRLLKLTDYIQELLNCGMHTLMLSVV